MAQFITEANQMIARISKRYAYEQYGDMAKRQRGIAVPVKLNINNILLGDLRQNQIIPGLLTPDQRDNLINELI